MAFISDTSKNADDELADFNPMWYYHGSFHLAYLEHLPELRVGFSQVHDGEEIEPLGYNALPHRYESESSTLLIHFGKRKTALIRIRNSGDPLMENHIREHLRNHATHVTSFHIKRYGEFGAALIDAICTSQEEFHEMAEAEENRALLDFVEPRWKKDTIISDAPVDYSSYFLRLIESISFFKDFLCKAEVEKDLKKEPYANDWKSLKESYLRQYKIGQIPAGISVASLTARSTNTYGLQLVPLHACEKTFHEDHVLSLVSKSGIACLVLLESSMLFEHGARVTEYGRRLVEWTRERIQPQGEPNGRENKNAVYASVGKSLVEEHRQFGKYKVWPGREIPKFSFDHDQTLVIDYIVIEPDFDADEFMI